MKAKRVATTALVVLAATTACGQSAPRVQGAGAAAGNEAVAGHGVSGDAGGTAPSAGGTSGRASTNGGTAGADVGAAAACGGNGVSGGQGGSSGGTAAGGYTADAGAESGGHGGRPAVAGATSSGGRATAGNTGSSGAGGMPARPTVIAAPGTTLVKVNTNVHHQTFEGWGTSLCWWANHVGGWSASAQSALVSAVVDPVNGLGYNVFRYNIGGGDNPSHDHMDAFRQMPGFEPSEGTWDWDADANQRAVLQGLVASGTGVIVEAFSNSPPYWMTKSGCASGNTDGSNNLKDDSYDAFADYLTEVVKHYRDVFGITFRTLEALNEPNADWWKANGSQEGCHFSPSNQQTIIKAVGAALTAKGLTGTSVSASDENSIDDAYDNMRAFDSATLAVMSQMNTHTYAGSDRASLRALATSQGKRLWQSESGPLNQTLATDTDAALFMAGRIISDLRDLQAEAWIDWQPGDPARSWASFVLNDSGQSFSLLKRFYMHAGFSRYIRPGATFVDVNDADMVAAVNADGHTLTLVVRNGSTSASSGITVDLTTLPSVGATVSVYRTSQTEDLAALPGVAIQNFSFQATLPAYSVTTFVIPLT